LNQTSLLKAYLHKTNNKLTNHKCTLFNPLTPTVAICAQL